MIDEGKLIAWLREREAATRSTVLASIYAGLRARIERGDFSQ